MTSDLTACLVYCVVPYAPAFLLTQLPDLFLHRKTGVILSFSCSNPAVASPFLAGVIQKVFSFDPSRTGFQQNFNSCILPSPYNSLFHSSVYLLPFFFARRTSPTVHTKPDFRRQQNERATCLFLIDLPWQPCPLLVLPHYYQHAFDVLSKTEKILFLVSFFLVPVPS